MRRTLLFFALSAAPSAVVVAQSSQLSVSGLGIPGRGLSVHSWATGGSNAIFDGESSLNPAALSNMTVMTATLTGVEDFRRMENPAGDASGRSVRFPQFTVAGSIRDRPLSFGLSFASYTTRDYTFGVVDTIDLRGAAVQVGDTFSSRGGLSDLRAGASYRLGQNWAAGAALHVITGSNRLQVVRGFADSSYVPTRQRTEIGYAGVGVSVGILGKPAASLAVALVARSDGVLNVTRNNTKTGTIDLPYTFAGGVQWRPATQLDLDASVTARTWSAANSDLLATGEAGAKNTVEASFGGQFVPDPRRPFRRPIRFGVRYATLPFLFNAVTEQPHEVGVSIGTGGRFAASRAGIDLGLERLWRSASGYSESAWLLSVGVSVRP